MVRRRSDWNRKLYIQMFYDKIPAYPGVKPSRSHAIQSKLTRADQFQDSLGIDRIEFEDRKITKIHDNNSFNIFDGLYQIIHRSVAA